MNPFENANLTVESYGTYKQNEYNMDRTGAHKAFRAMKEEEGRQQEERMQAQMESAKATSDMYASIAAKKMNRQANLNRLASFSATAKNVVLKDILFEMYKGSLLLDEEFVTEQSASLKKLVDDYVDNANAYQMLEEAVKEKRSPYLAKLKEACDTIALEVCKRKVKECDEKPEYVDFNLTDDEKAAIDFSKDNLSVDQISDMVKDKVLTVVKDEQEKEAKNKALVEEIEEDLKEDENVTDEKSLDEAFHNIVIKESVLEETTLFNALFRNCVAEYVTENMAVTHNPGSDEAQEEIGLDEDDIMDDEPEDTLDSQYDDIDYDDTIELESSNEINMDAAFAEALAKYTLMEMLHTIKLERYTHDNVRKLTHSLVSPVPVVG